MEQQEQQGQQGQQEQREVSVNDRRLLRAELRSLVTGINLVVLVIAIAAGMWGVFDGMTDAGGDRFAGIMTIVAPSVYAGWCMLEVALRRGTSPLSVLTRLVSACLIAPGLVVVPIAVAQAVAVVFPGIRHVIEAAAEDNGGFHYYWAEGIGAQLFLVPLAGWGIGMVIALGVCMILTLPILSLRAPDTVSSGSHIEAVAAQRRAPTTAFVFCGLGATMLGIVLWVFGDGGSIAEFPEDLGRFIQTLSSGYVDWHGAMWLIGVVLVVAGVVSMAWGCVPVMAARRRGD
jgi:hypothetical protein